MLKNLYLVVALSYTIAIVFVSVINLSNVPSLGSSFDDKIYHFGAYFVLGILWALFFLTTKFKKALLISYGLTLAFGIIIEILQEKLNPLRTYDILDLLANCLGVSLGTVVIWYLTKTKVKIK